MELKYRTFQIMGSYSQGDRHIVGRFTLLYEYVSGSAIELYSRSSEMDQESDFSVTAYNSAYVSDAQSLIAKITLQQFFG